MAPHTKRHLLPAVTWRALALAMAFPGLGLHAAPETPLRDAFSPVAVRSPSGTFGAGDAPVANPLDTLQQALAGRYIIERELGHGATATVYLAQDLKHPRKVALKAPHALTSRDPLKVPPRRSVLFPPPSEMFVAAGGRFPRILCSES